MLIEMATGRRPFESETPYSIAVMQVTQPTPAPRTINPSVLPGVEQVIYTAMSKQREDRFPTATGFAEALQHAAAQGASGLAMTDTQPGGIPVPRSTTPPPVERYPPPPTSGNMAPVKRRRLRRGNNLLLSVIIGGLIGCSLLTLVLTAVAFVIGDTQRQEGAMRTQTAQVATFPAVLATEPVTDEPSVTPLPGILEGDLEGRPTNEPESVATEIAPIGVRGTLTLSSGEAVPDAVIVYFAERDGNFDLYRLNLRTREDVRLTTQPTIDMYPQVSPDARQIVFVSDRDGDYDLYLMDTDGDNLRQLTRNDVTDRIPAWSPDGTWIVFSSDTRGGGSHDIYQIRADGTDLTLVYSDGLRNSHPRWSADDHYLIFTGGIPTEGDTWEIMRFDRRNNEALLLTNNTVRDWSPVYTPDNQGILYLTEGEGDAAFATMNLDGSQRQLFYDGPGYEWGALFSPDARYLLFTSDASGQDELYLLWLETDFVQQITNDGGSYATWLRYNGS
jgi:TolB protein